MTEFIFSTFLLYNHWSLWENVTWVAEWQLKHFLSKNIPLYLSMDIQTIGIYVLHGTWNCTQEHYFPPKKCCWKHTCILGSTSANFGNICYLKYLHVNTHGTNFLLVIDSRLCMKGKWNGPLLLDAIEHQICRKVLFHLKELFWTEKVVLFKTINTINKL